MLYTLALVLGMGAALRAVLRSQGADAALRAGLLAGAVALVAVGLFDHYPWTLIQFQVLQWGLLAVAAGDRSAPNHARVTMRV